MPVAAAAMARVAIQPMMRNGPLTMNLPITSSFDVMIIIITITGTATTPLVTALQNSVLIGSSGEKQMTVPNKVAATITA
jgi:hypothetical protein